MHLKVPTDFLVLRFDLRKGLAQYFGADLEQPRVLCCCDFACCAPHFLLDAIPAAAANCILTDYQREAVNQQLRELRGDRVGGGFQQMDMEKIMKWERRQRKGGRNKKNTETDWILNI